MAIKFKTKAAPAPQAAQACAPAPAMTSDVAVLDDPVFPEGTIYPAEYTILIALDEWHDRRAKGETLMLVHRTSGEGFEVIGFDKLTGKARLKNSQGALLNPKVGIREAGHYLAVWR